MKIDENRMKTLTKTGFSIAFVLFLIPVRKAYPVAGYWAASIGLIMLIFFTSYLSEKQ